MMPAKNDENVVDFGVEAQLLFEVIKYGKFSKFGLDGPVKFLRGVRSRDDLKNGQIKGLLGLGNSRSNGWWNAFCRLLYLRKFVHPEKPENAAQKTMYELLFRDCNIVLSAAGEEFLNGDSKELFLWIPKSGTYSCLIPIKYHVVARNGLSDNIAKENGSKNEERQKEKVLSYEPVASLCTEMHSMDISAKYKETVQKPIQQSLCSVFDNSDNSACETESNGIIASVSMPSLSSGTDSCSSKFMLRMAIEEVLKCRYQSFSYLFGSEEEQVDESPSTLSLVEVFRSFGGKPSCYALHILLQHSFDMIAWCKAVSVDEVGDDLAASAKDGFPLHLSVLGIDEATLNGVLAVVEAISGDSRNIDLLVDQFADGQVSRNQLKVILAIFEYEQRED